MPRAIRSSRLAVLLLGSCGDGSDATASSSTTSVHANDTGTTGTSAVDESGSVGPGTDATSSETNDAEETGAPVVDVGSPDALTPCPTRGDGAIVAPAACVVFTPADAGAVHGDIDGIQYALEPGGPSTGNLVVYLNASLSSPSMQIADPMLNFYVAAALEGHRVLALSYHSQVVLGAPNQCGADPECYPATRRAVLLGEPVDGAVASVADITLDEGVVARIDAALALVAAHEVDGGWAELRVDGGTPAERIRWDRVIATGHSQGGGHAAFLGTLFGLHRVVQLASTCDAIADAPAPWTFADGWPTDPSVAYYGLGSMDDTTICPAHQAIWDAMGMDPRHQHDDAATCAGGGHGGPIACVENFDRWRELLRE